MDETLREKIEAYIHTMPSLSTTMFKVLEVCNNPHTSSADLNRVISLDPVLVGRVLKLINSAYYGLEQQVTNLVRAVIMLGINTVKNLALSSAVMGSFQSDELQGLDAEGYWRHSLCVGVAAKLIARKRGVDPRLLEDYFTAGLLHDIGKIPLNAALSGGYLLAVKDADSRRVPLFQGETEKLGINHSEAGKLVVNAWRIGGGLADAVIHHHAYRDYAGEHKDLLYSIVAANYFASFMEIGFSGCRHPRRPEDTVWETLGLAWEDIEDIKPVVDKEIEKAQIFLNLT
ncbi:MAG: HDOD domain-containing protein [Treponema sp.]|jgi:HD-like signal output (HDOD) protein|nr:HDOD domain-containing protein [Treponema sp.]